MKTRVYSLTFLFIFGLSLSYAQDDSGSARYQEHEVKAAFLYNFVKFTDWPAGKVTEPNTITIGLLGEHSFGNAFDPVKNKSVKDKRLIIKDFGRFSQFITSGENDKLRFKPEVEQLRKCHLLFICDSEREYFKVIVEAVKGYKVLTVGETKDFLEFGGIITFIPETEKPVFEVNLNTCESEGLKISSMVLRLAQKVIGGKDIDLSSDKNK